MILGSKHVGAILNVLMHKFYVCASVGVLIICVFNRLIVKGGGSSSVEIFLLYLYTFTQDGQYVWPKHVAENRKERTEFVCGVCVDRNATEQAVKYQGMIYEKHLHFKFHSVS